MGFLQIHQINQLELGDMLHIILTVHSDHIVITRFRATLFSHDFMIMVYQNFLTSSGHSVFLASLSNSKNIVCSLLAKPRFFQVFCGY